MIFKVLPDVTLAWSDVWIGAVATAALFTIGKFAIGLYLGKGSIGSAYGAAGSVIIMIAWIYYSAQISLSRCGVQTGLCQSVWFALKAVRKR